MLCDVRRVKLLPQHTPVRVGVGYADNAVSIVVAHLKAP